MAISKNFLLTALSGSVADQLTIKNYGNKVVVCNKIGPRTKKATAKQEENEDRFREANSVVKARYADLKLREEARQRLNVQYGSPLFRAMLKEYYEELRREEV